MRKEFFNMYGLILILAVLIIGNKQESNTIAFKTYSNMMTTCHSSFLPSEIFTKQKYETVAVKPVVKKVVNRGLPRMVFSAEEYEMLCRISASETTEGNLRQKMNVISSVINRVEHYGSIEKAIFAPRQYSVISDRRYFTEKITELDRKAVDEVMMKGVTHDLIFFKARYCSSPWFDNSLQFVFEDGLHEFYKVK